MEAGRKWLEGLWMVRSDHVPKGKKLGGGVSLNMIGRRVTKTSVVLGGTVCGGQDKYG